MNRSAGKRRKYEEIAEHLELLIVSGRLHTGDRIPSERELMTQFGAGRSSVREALFVLQRKGLLVAGAGAVPRVRKPTAAFMVAELSGIARLLLNRPDGIRQLQDARLLFEVGVAREAAQRIDDASRDMIRDALAENEAAADHEEFMETDLAFHAAIARSCGNPAYLAMATAFSEWLYAQRVVSAGAGATREEAIAQHRAIFETIAAGTHVEAEAAMERHLRTVVEYYWRGAS